MGLAHTSMQGVVVERSCPRFLQSVEDDKGGRGGARRAGG